MWWEAAQRSLQSGPDPTAAAIPKSDYLRMSRMLSKVMLSEAEFDRDEAQAAEWYRRAGTPATATPPGGDGDGDGEIAEDEAETRGHAGAQFNLGVMYKDGTGVAQDDARAYEWTRLAAEQGYADAQCNLGCMYAEGDGVGVDLGLALRWFHKAVAQGHPTAGGAIAHYLQVRREEQALHGLLPREPERGAPSHGCMSVPHATQIM